MSSYLELRRRLDRLIATIGGVAAIPLFALLLGALRCLQGRSTVITVPRIGMGGAPFQMWKVRTMVPAQGGLAEGSRITLPGDSRVTPIGRYLRLAHIDEVPQLLNVAKGEMMLFGPRPETPEYVRADRAAWQPVLSAPPGIAGPSQLALGRLERDILEVEGECAYGSKILPLKLSMDAAYVRGATLSTDCQWLLITTLQLLGWAKRSLSDAVAELGHDVSTGDLEAILPRLAVRPFEQSRQLGLWKSPIGPGEQRRMLSLTGRS